MHVRDVCLNPHLRLHSCDSLCHIDENAQAGLEAAYVGLSDEGFPSLRRKLTRSKQRMSWDVHAHRLAKMISK